MRINQFIKLLDSDKLIKIILGLFFTYLIIELLSIYFALPTAQEIAKAFSIYWTEGDLTHDVKVSIARWLSGWMIGSLIGITLGFITGRSYIASLFLEGIIVILKVIPFIALLPLILHIFGLSETGKIFLIAWASASISWTIIHEKAKNIPKIILWKSKSLGINGWKWIVKILIPYCRNEIFSSTRNSLGLALIVLAVAELSGVYERTTGLWWSEGLGYRIFRAEDQARYDIMMAAILLFSFLGLIFDFMYSEIIRWFETQNSIIKRKYIRRDAVNLKDYEEQLFDTYSLKVDNLIVGYDNNNIINNLSFQINKGKTLSVIGYSGSGKTTLLKGIGKLEDNSIYSNGLISLNNKEITENSPALGFVFQENSIFDFLTVWENVTIGNNVDKSFSLFLLKKFDLLNLIEFKANKLSGGEKQRLAFASTLANKPSLLLLDEPFGKLDAITRNKLQQFYLNEISNKITTVFVTHDIDEALKVGDEILIGVNENARIITDNNGIDIDRETVMNMLINSKRNTLK